MSRNLLFDDNFLLFKKLITRAGQFKWHARKITPVDFKNSVVLTKQRVNLWEDL